MFTSAAIAIPHHHQPIDFQYTMELLQPNRSPSANRRLDKRYQFLFDTAKLSAIIINGLVIILLIGTLIVEIVIHQQNEFLRDRDTREPIQKAFAKSGCLAVFLTTSVIIIVPLVGCVGLCIENTVITIGYAFAMLLICIVSAFILPYGYVIATLLALGAISAMVYVKAIQIKNQQQRTSLDDQPLS